MLIKLKISNYDVTQDLTINIVTAHSLQQNNTTNCQWLLN